MQVINLPFNTVADGTCRTIKSNYADVSRANFLRGREYGATAVVVPDCRPDSMVQPPPPSCRIAGYIWKSRQNGMVYDPEGISPTIVVGHHAGVEPKIIEYDK